MYPRKQGKVTVMITAKKQLEIYAHIDLDGEVYDIDTITQCMRVYFLAKQKEYDLTHLQCITLDKHSTSADVLERGLFSLCQMYNQLKLKTKDEVWFIYMSVGNLKNLQDNVTLLLVNKSPSERECLYSIHKRMLDVKKTSDKTSKLCELKILTKSLSEVLSTTKKIRYRKHV